MSDAPRTPGGDDRLRRSAAALAQMRREIEELERRRSEPIAIVGMACRYPGGANSPEAFWEVLRDGRDTLVRVPPERWDADAYYDPDPDAYWKTDTVCGHFIDQPVDAFEPELFGISPREALSLDPQQRLLLEVSWEALENAGIAPDGLARSETGVYIGMISTDYGRVPFTDLAPGDLPYVGTGNGSSFEAGRISYVLGLQGPSMVVATACSSTLVSTHLACQALRNRECDLALSGGVALMVFPDTSIILSQMRATAPDGRSKTFDRNADGFGRGEGCGVLALKRLADAQRDGDDVLALVRGSAVNHDGASGGITVPNGPAQEKVVRRALAAGRHDPADVDLVEAHGTGTPLGDPIELIALGSVFGGAPRATGPLLVGSVKTNIGHLEAAAGVAGIMKLTLALRHEQIPPHRNLTELTDKVPWDDLPLRVATEPTPWPRGDRERVAGVSSFGLSGINAHVLVSEAPPAPAPPPPAPPQPELLLLSARTDRALDVLRAQVADVLDGDGEADGAPALADVCATAASGRALMSRRLAVVGSDRAGVARALRGDDPAAAVRGSAAGAPSRIAFLFTGQGAQSAGMGRALYDCEAVFRATLDHCAEVLRDVLEAPLLSVIFAGDPDDRRLHETAYTQPALVALELALARQWEAWGVRPDVVIGHSVGEYAAACVAGIFAVDEALLLVAERARRMQAQPKQGTMTMIAAPEDEVRDALSRCADRVAVAAVNGPRNVVISGRRGDVGDVAQGFAARGVRTQDLVVSHAFHSPLMAPVAAGFDAVAGRVRYAPASVPVVSNLAGRRDPAMSAPAYWVRQICGTVRFHAGLQAIADEGIDTFLEIGPRPVLTGMGRHFVAGGRWLASLTPKTHDRAQMLQSLAALLAGGGPGDARRLYPRGAHRRVTLPNTPFQRKRYWLPLKDESHPPARPSHLPPAAERPHPLLGTRLPIAGRTAIFEARLHPGSPAWLRDHTTYGSVVLPAAGYLEMALAAARHVVKGSAPLRLSEVTITRPILLSDEASLRVQLLLHDEGADAFTWEIHSLQEGSWRRHAAGRVAADRAIAAPPRTDLAALRAACPTAAPVDDFYDLVASRGLAYGPAFRALRSFSSGASFAVGEVELDAQVGAQAGDYEIHPILLDACLQALGAMFPYADDEHVFLPTGVEELVLHGPAGPRQWVRASLAPVDNGGPPTAADFTILDDDGEVVAQVRGLRFARAPRASLMPAGERPWRQWLFGLDWTRLPALAASERAALERSWLLVGDETGLASELAGALRAAGGRAVVARPGAGFAHLDDDAYAIEPERPEDLRRLLREIAAAGRGPLDAIVYLAPDRPAQLDPQLPDAEVGDVTAAWRAGAGGLLHLVQAIAAEAWLAAPQVAVVTCDATSAGGRTPAGWLAQTTTGVAKVVAREHPELRCRVVDVDPADARAVPALVDELAATGGEPHVALRDGERWGERLAVPRPPAFGGAAIRADGTYVLAGGLGGLGLATAAHLAARGAGRIVLAGRNPPSEHVAARLEALRADGTLVEFVAVDLGRADSVRELVTRADTAEHPLRGIFNLAASFDDGILLNCDLARFAGVLAPKVEGSWNLHRCSEHLGLDHFVLFGSAAGLVGNAGQASYAAANAFLDGLAGHRRARGLPCTTIDWGAWEDVGATAGDDMRERLARQGVQTIDVGEGMEILDHLLVRGTERIAVLPLDGAPSGELARHPLLAGVTGAGASSQGPAPLADELRAASPARRGDLMVEHAQRVVGAVLGIPDDAPIDVRLGFFDLGMDSMMALEVRNRLAASLGIALPGSIALDHPTVDRLSDHLLELLFAGDEEAVATDEDLPGELADLLDEIEALSDADTQTRLR